MCLLVSVFVCTQFQSSNISCYSPVCDKVISQTTVALFCVGCPAGLNHKSDYVAVQPLGVHIYVDGLVRLDPVWKVNGFGAGEVGEHAHRQSVFPRSRYNLLQRSAAEHTHTHSCFCHITFITWTFMSYLLPGSTDSVALRTNRFILKLNVILSFIPEEFCDCLPNSSGWVV